MAEHPNQSQPDREQAIELGEARKSLDSLIVPPPVPVETPMSSVMDAAPVGDPSAGPESRPPTDFDG